jgi:para-nitrobenzyl esterase
MTTHGYRTRAIDRRTFLEITGAAAAGLCLPASLGAQSSGGSESIVATSAGRLRGVVRDGVHAFKGVPYAASPAGAARFQAPTRVKPWTGVRERSPSDRERRSREADDS